MKVALAPLQSLISLSDSGTWGDEAEPITGVPVLRSTNIEDFRLILEDIAWRKLSARDAERRALREGDVLVTKSSGSSNHIGKCCLFSQPPDGRTYYFSNFTLRLRADPAQADARWLFYWLISPMGRGELARINNTTTGLRNLDVPRYLAQLVPTIDVSAQRSVCDTLDKADAIRRKRKEAIALTEELLRSTFLHMVGPNAEGYSRWQERAIEDLAAQVPNAMRTGPFGSDLRHSEFVSKGIAVLGIDNAVQNRFAWGERRFVTTEKYEKLKRYAVRPGDVIVTIMGTTGRSAVVPEDIPTAITTKHLATITLNRSVAHPEFVSQSFHAHPELLAQIEKAGRGAIMNGLNLGLIRALRVRVPPMNQQSRFLEQVKRIRSVECRMLTALQESEGLFASLLHRAFRGELTAPASRSTSSTSKQLSLLG